MRTFAETETELKLGEDGEDNVPPLRSQVMRRVKRKRVRVRRTAGGRSRIVHTTVATGRNDTSQAIVLVGGHPPPENLARVSEEDAKTLIQAAKSGDVDKVACVLSGRQTLPQHAIADAFMVAAEYGYTQVVEYLGGTHAHRGSFDQAMILAARNGHKEVVAYLLEMGASIEAHGKNGETPLLAAVENNREAMVKMLIAKKADIVAVDDDRNSFLHIASRQGLPNMVALGLRNGALPYVVNEDDETPIEVAANEEVARIILLRQSLESAMHGSISQEPPVQCSYPPLNTPPAGSQPTRPAPQSPFKPFPPGVTNNLFWHAIGMGKDHYIFHTLNVYPFDRLHDSERVVVLAEVAEAMSGYTEGLEPNILNESALFAVFAMVKKRVRNEIDRCYDEKCTEEGKYLWRRRILDSFEEVFKTDGYQLGVSVECMKIEVWEPMVEMIALYLFGESFWEKQQMFTCPNSLQRRQFMARYKMSASYYKTTLPERVQLEPHNIQLTFKKLITMSKSFLKPASKTPTHDSSLSMENQCFCPDCIAEREVPLNFKLQYLEESAEGNQRKKKRKYCKKVEDERTVGNLRDLRALRLRSKTELSNFWTSITMEEKWNLTEITISELSEILTKSCHWETLRAALKSYTKYAWDSDLLEITDNVVTIADDMYESRGMEELLGAVLDAVSQPSKVNNSKKGNNHYLVDIDHLREVVGPDNIRSSLKHLALDTPPPPDPDETDSSKGSQGDVWERYGRQMLENIVLCEFARKVAYEYLRKRDETAARAAALELELQLIQEEEQQKKTSKKQKRKRKRKRGKGKAQEAPPVPGPEELDIDAKEEKSNSPLGPVPTTPPRLPERPPNLEQPAPVVPGPSNGRRSPRATNKTEFCSSNPFDIIRTAEMQSNSKRDKNNKRTNESSQNNRRRGKKKKKGAPASDTNPPKPSPASRLPTPATSGRRSGPQNGAHTQSSQQRTSNKGGTLTSTGSKKQNRFQNEWAWMNRYTDGMMFICSSDTYDECMQLKLLGLPTNYLRQVQNLHPETSALFLFNMTDRNLHGVYSPSGPGKEYIDAEAWVKTKGPNRRGKSPYPAQIPFTTTHEFEQLADDKIMHMFESRNRVRHLDQEQVRELLHIFRQASPNSSRRNKAKPKSNQKGSHAKNSPQNTPERRAKARGKQKTKSPTKPKPPPKSPSEPKAKNSPSKQKPPKGKNAKNTPSSAPSVTVSNGSPAAAPASSKTAAAPISTVNIWQQRKAARDLKEREDWIQKRQLEDMKRQQQAAAHAARVTIRQPVVGPMAQTLIRQPMNGTPKLAGPTKPPKPSGSATPTKQLASPATTMGPNPHVGSPWKGTKVGQGEAKPLWGNALGLSNKPPMPTGDPSSSPTTAIRTAQSANTTIMHNAGLPAKAIVTINSFTQQQQQQSPQQITQQGIASNSPEKGSAGRGSPSLTADSQNSKTLFGSFGGVWGPGANPKASVWSGGVDPSNAGWGGGVEPKAGPVWSGGMAGGGRGNWATPGNAGVWQNGPNSQPGMPPGPHPGIPGSTHHPQPQFKHGLPPNPAPKGYYAHARAHASLPALNPDAKEFSQGQHASSQFGPQAAYMYAAQANRQALATHQAQAQAMMQHQGYSQSALVAGAPNGEGNSWAGHYQQGHQGNGNGPLQDGRPPNGGW